MAFVFFSFLSRSYLLYVHMYFPRCFPIKWSFIHLDTCKGSASHTCLGACCKWPGRYQSAWRPRYHLSYARAGWIAQVWGIGQCPKTAYSPSPWHRTYYGILRKGAGRSTLGVDDRVSYASVIHPFGYCRNVPCAEHSSIGRGSSNSLCCFSNPLVLWDDTLCTEYLHSTYIANGDARMLHVNSLQMQPLEGNGIGYEVDPSVQRSDAMISGMRIAIELFPIPRVKDRPQGV